MNSQTYIMRCFTNMHVGSGEVNYGIIDNLIDRDACTGFPSINGSGIKGAIKQMFYSAVSEHFSIDFKQVFGSDDRDERAGKESDSKNYQQGKCLFMPAHLLAIPVRSDAHPYLLATSPALLREYKRRKDDISMQETNASLLDLKPTQGSALCLKETKGTFVGSHQIAVDASLNSDQHKTLQEIINAPNTPCCLISDAYMAELCDDFNLPVIARNVLENGQSTNLWYEQVLPRESRLFFSILDTEANALEKITKLLTTNTLQIGANASVGYGFTKIYTSK